jgi:hypothetical protein
MKASFMAEITGIWGRTEFISSRVIIEGIFWKG